MFIYIYPLYIVYNIIYIYMLHINYVHSARAPEGVSCWSLLPLVPVVCGCDLPIAFQPIFRAPKKTRLALRTRPTMRTQPTLWFHEERNWVFTFINIIVGKTYIYIRICIIYIRIHILWYIYIHCTKAWQDYARVLFRT